MRKRLLLSAAALVAIACVVLLVLAMLPPRPGVTKANFDRIEIGMTRSEVEIIFGEPSEATSSTTPLGGKTTTSDDWFQLGRGIANIYFNDELVVNKEWQAVPESFTQKIRRWLHLP